MAPETQGVLWINYSSPGSTGLPFGIETELSFLERTQSHVSKLAIYYVLMALVIVVALLSFFPFRHRIFLLCAWFQYGNRMLFFVVGWFVIIITSLQSNLGLHERLNALEARYAEASELAEHHGKVLADATHDIRQPLFALRASLKSIKQKPDEQSVASASRSLLYLENLVEEHMANAQTDDAARLLAESPNVPSGAVTAKLKARAWAWISPWHWQNNSAWLPLFVRYPGREVCFR